MFQPLLSLKGGEGFCLVPVHIEVAVGRAGLELEDPRFCIFLDQCDYLQRGCFLRPNILVDLDLERMGTDTDRNGNVEV